MRHDVIAMEDYVATDQRPLEKCLADVTISDIYIGIFAWRYGYIPPEMNPEHKSITELEYRKAKQTGKICLLFLLDEEAAWPSTEMDALSDKDNRGESIKALRNELTQEKIVSYFKTPEELASLVGVAVHLQTKNLEKMEKEERLHAILWDHTGFLHNRLASFVGREQELAIIRSKIEEHMPTGGYVMITGQAGQGKSSIIAKLVDAYGPENVAYHFIPFNPGPDHQIGLMRNLMARLILKYDLPDLYVASESRPALHDYFPHVLSDVSKKGGREVIFLDGLDQLEEDATGIRDLTFLPTNPPPGLVFVLGSRPNDALKPLELLKHRDEYRLPNLSRDDFERILQHRHVILERMLTDRFYQAMQENALYLDLVAQELATSGGIRPEEIIERVSINPENLFSLSMMRLKRQRGEWREVVKPTLGILLVAREPLSFPHIRQILHLDADQLKEGMERLGGLVNNDGSGRYGLFHLKFYDYLRQDEMNPQKDYIFARDEEEYWHKTLANWCEQGNIELIWTDSLSNRVEQERRIYGRKHFITHLYSAQNWERVFAVLDAHTFGQRKVRYDPSTRSYTDDLDLGRNAAAWENWSFDEGISLLPRLWRYTLLRCSLASRADRYPEGGFRVLMLLGRDQEALGLAELLTDREKKVGILISMAKVLEQQLKREGSRTKHENFINLFTRAYEVAASIEDNSRRDEALRKLGAALAQAQEREQAEQVIASIADSYERAMALSALASALAQAQEREQAQVVCRQAEQVIASIEEYRDIRSVALSALASALAQAQEWTQAEQVIASIADSYYRAEALSALGVALTQAQKREQAQVVWTQAEQVTASIADSTSRTWALRELEGALTQAQEWTQAERVIVSIADSSHRIMALSALGAALAQAEERERAQAVWTQAERVIVSIADSYDRAWALIVLGTGLAQAQEREQAQAVCMQAEQVIASIADSLRRPQVLSALADAVAQAQEWTQAERVIASMEDNHDQAQALSTLATALAQAEESEQAQAVWTQAEQVIASIADSDSRAEALSTLATALAQAHEWTQAEQVIASIADRSRRAQALRELADALIKSNKHLQLLRLIQHSWRKADTRDYAAELLSLANGLLPLKPEIGIKLCESFAWVDDFLRG